MVRNNENLDFYCSNNPRSKRCSNYRWLISRNDGLKRFEIASFRTDKVLVIQSENISDIFSHLVDLVGTESFINIGNFKMLKNKYGYQKLDVFKNDFYDLYFRAYSDSPYFISIDILKFLLEWGKDTFQPLHELQEDSCLFSLILEDLFIFMIIALANIKGMGIFTNLISALDTLELHKYWHDERNKDDLIDLKRKIRSSTNFNHYLDALGHESFPCLEVLNNFKNSIYDYSLDINYDSYPAKIIDYWNEELCELFSFIIEKKVIVISPYLLKYHYKILKQKGFKINNPYGILNDYIYLLIKSLARYSFRGWGRNVNLDIPLKEIVSEFFSYLYHKYTYPTSKDIINRALDFNKKFFIKKELILPTILLSALFDVNYYSESNPSKIIEIMKFCEIENGNGIIKSFRMLYKYLNFYYKGKILPFLFSNSPNISEQEQKIVQLFNGLCIDISSESFNLFQKEMDILDTSKNVLNVNISDYPFFQVRGFIQDLLDDLGLQIISRKEKRTITRYFYYSLIFIFIPLIFFIPSENHMEFMDSLRFKMQRFINTHGNFFNEMKIVKNIISGMDIKIFSDEDIYDEKGKIRDIFETEEITERYGQLFEEFCEQNGLFWPAEEARRFGPLKRKQFPWNNRDPEEERKCTYKFRE